MDVSELKIVLEFIESTYFSQSLKELAQSSADFFVHKFRLGNCYVELYDAHHRYFTNQHLSRAYTLVEKRMRSFMSNTRTPLFITQPQTDPLLGGVEGVDYAISAFPIVVQKEHIGNIYLYGDQVHVERTELIGQMVQKLVNAALHVKNYTEVKHSAITDPLTKLYNKTYFHETLKREIARAFLTKDATSLIILDIDNFKNFNDTRGHIEGDVLLKGLAEVLRKHAGESQTPSRFGGEEFVILLPSTNKNAAYAWADNLRKDIAASVDATVSVGICTCANSSASASEMMKRADEAMYKSKRTGKNKVSQYLIIDRALGVIDVHDTHGIP
jgi:diguanylate cyclase (GGDEF)-like protein